MRKSRFIVITGASIIIGCVPDSDAEHTVDWSAVPEWRLTPQPVLQLGGADAAEPELFGNLRAAAPAE